MRPSNSELQLQLQNRLVEELGLKHREFETLTELLEEVVYRCDSEGKLTFMNGSWTLRTGWDIDTTIGKELADYIVDTELAKQIRIQFLSDEPIAREVELYCKGHGSKIFLLNARKSGESWYGSLQDVTEQRGTMQALEQSQKKARKLSLVASKTDNMVIISDANGRIEWVNKSFERITGFRMFEVKGYSPSRFLQGQLTDPETIKTMRSGLSSGEGFAVEVVNYSKSKEPYWISIDCSPVHDEDGNTINFIAIEREITDRKNAEVLLRESETTLKQILDTVNEAIIRCDRKLDLHFVNSAWIESTGCGLSEDMNLNLAQFIHDEDHELLNNTRDKSLLESCEAKCELRMKAAEGGYRRIELQLSSNVTVGEEERQLTGAIIDVHDRWQQTQAILQAKLEAEELTRTRTRFVANMSHEIRTPLNAIIGMASVLEASDLDSKQRTCVETLTNGGKALLALVHDVLDMSKLDSDRTQLENSKFRILALCEEVVDLIAARVEEKGLSLRLIISNDIPSRVVGDSNKIRQILINLLSNAVKFTDKGEIDFRVDWQPISTGSGVLEISIKDSGIGIDVEHLKTLFDPFTQSDPSITRRYGGTGLGLSICRQICQAMKGSIEVSSELGDGACFRIKLPLQIEQALITVNGDTSLESINLDERVRPVIDSFSYCNGLRAVHKKSDSRNASVSLLGDGGNVQSTIAFLSEEAVLTPLRIWRKLSAARGVASRPGKEAISNIQSDLKILVAEDVLANQVVIKMILSQLGYTNVTVVENGELAVNHLQQCPVDVAIFDIHMPVMDGITAARIIRENKDIMQPKIIATSADVTTDSKQAAAKAGFDEWLPKPLNRSNLEALLRNIAAQIAGDLTNNKPNQGDTYTVE